MIQRDSFSACGGALREVAPHVPVGVGRPPLSMDPIARRLAAAWLYGDWTLEGLTERTRAALGRRRLNKSLEFLIGGFWRDLRSTPHERSLVPLAEAIGFHTSYRRIRHTLRLPPLPAATRWELPDPKVHAELADWLELDAAELDWLADELAISNHYRRFWRGSRLIEAPRPRLKAIQQRLLEEWLDRIPVHTAAHGFRRGRSVLTAVSVHSAQPVVVRLDMRAFFPSVRAARVHAMLVRFGYDHAFARTLTNLCTTRCRTLPDAAQPISSEVRHHYRSRHLPQGAPPSPALANLCAFRLDSRLSGLARELDGRYSRYADDLIFSGPRTLGSRRFVRCVERIVEDEGFTVNPVKTRVMTQSTQQRILGLIINAGPRIPRAELQRLEATLVNCVRSGPAQQNRDGHPDFRAHLSGRISWVRQVESERADRLEELFASIRWP